MEGMVVSNEPGYYEDGNFGVRIENLLIIKAAATDHVFGGQPFLDFERLTLVPLQAKMIDLPVHPPPPPPPPQPAPWPVTAAAFMRLRLTLHVQDTTGISSAPWLGAGAQSSACIAEDDLIQPFYRQPLQ